MVRSPLRQSRFECPTLAASARAASQVWFCLFFGPGAAKLAFWESPPTPCFPLDSCRSSFSPVSHELRFVYCLGGLRSVRSFTASALSAFLASWSLLRVTLSVVALRWAARPSACLPTSPCFGFRCVFADFSSSTFPIAAPWPLVDLPRTLTLVWTPPRVSGRPWAASAGSCEGS